MLNYFIPDRIYKDIYEINIRELKRKNIRAVIFDIDNTLVAYTQKNADGKLIKFLKKFEAEGFNVCFLSNNNTERVDAFNRDFNFFACADSKKPFTKSFYKALEHFRIKDNSIKRENIAVVGDQLFTDVLAARRMKMTAILVSPIEPVETMFFKIKRIGEKPFLRIYKRRTTKTVKKEEK